MWEYKVLSSPGEVMLNNLGREGWELVAVEFYSTPASGSNYYLKRRILK
jgi:hypothetical protein